MMGDLLTEQEAAQELGLSKDQLFLLHQNGAFNARKPAGEPAISRQDLLNWLAIPVEYALTGSLDFDAVTDRDRYVAYGLLWSVFRVKRGWLDMRVSRSAAFTPLPHVRMDDAGYYHLGDVLRCLKMDPRQRR